MRVWCVCVCVCVCVLCMAHYCDHCTWHFLFSCNASVNLVSIFKLSDYKSLSLSLSLSSLSLSSSHLKWAIDTLQFLQAAKLFIIFCLWLSTLIPSLIELCVIVQLRPIAILFSSLSLSLSLFSLSLSLFSLSLSLSLCSCSLLLSSFLLFSLSLFLSSLSSFSSLFSLLFLFSLLSSSLFRRSRIREF